MRSVKKALPVPCRMANLAILDIVDGREKGFAKRDDEGEYHFRMEVYGNTSGFTARTEASPGGCVLTAALTEPAAGLSEEGQSRAGLQPVGQQRADNARRSECHLRQGHGGV